MLDTTSAAEALWLDTAAEPAFPRLEGEIDVDVAIVGGGIAGVTAALLLKRAGSRVAVLEAARTARGVTGCTTAKVSALQATMYSTIVARHGQAAARAYAAASVSGVEQVAAIVAAEEIDCDLQRRPAYTYAADRNERDSVRRELAAARDAGLAVDWVDGPDLPYATDGAVRLPGQLQLHPVRYVQGMAAAVAGDGSHVFENSRVLGVDRGSPARVSTAQGVVRCNHVVIATHYPILDRGLYFARLDAQRSYCIAARLTGGELPQGMSISAGSNSRSIRSSGESLIVGGEGHPAGSRQAEPERFKALEAFAREHWSVAKVTHRWSAQDVVPYDHLPMIGAYRPGSDRLWVSTGFMKWGLSTATFAAMTIVDEISGAENPWASTFSPTRFSLRSAPALMQLGAKFSADLVGDRMRPPQALSAESIPVGEARIVQDGLGKKGVFRDGSGELHGVSLRCTHLGCLLRFNAAERSWDCPCHGSRFAVDGEVLEGPAVHPLQRRDP